MYLCQEADKGVYKFKQQTGITKAQQAATRRVSRWQEGGGYVSSTSGQVREVVRILVPEPLPTAPVKCDQMKRYQSSRSWWANFHPVPWGKAWPDGLLDVGNDCASSKVPRLPGFPCCLHCWSEKWCSPAQVDHGKVSTMYHTCQGCNTSTIPFTFRSTLTHGFGLAARLISTQLSGEKRSILTELELS
ncbi:hypothetical protein Bbelb_330220 [Branchiostoma belcheri]|nr:hypothetical protein Bbelb_330220 [Branchiostoma belcheri]